MTLDEAVFLIRGERGTPVTLTISREGQKQPLEIKIVRDNIQIPILDTEKKDNGIFVIKLYNFSENSPDAFRNALREMISSGSDKLILDLRGNPGGYLEASVDMASWFLPPGKIVSIEDFGNSDQENYRSRGYDIFKNLPFVILVDEGSASASEILAGALQDYKIATLVGTKTFGKGSVQELVPITGDTSLKLTIARWLTPNGRSISEKGLEPDVEVKMTEEDRNAGKDPQMQKAIEILTSKY
jgi:carboxyl-terminal processing protease